jgi:hypothetical protein
MDQGIVFGAARRSESERRTLVRPGDRDRAAGGAKPPSAAQPRLRRIDGNLGSGADTQTSGFRAAGGRQPRPKPAVRRGSLFEVYGRAGHVSNRRPPRRTRPGHDRATALIPVRSPRLSPQSGDQRHATDDLPPKKLSRQVSSESALAGEALFQKGVRTKLLSAFMCPGWRRGAPRSKNILQTQYRGRRAR